MIRAVVTLGLGAVLLAQPARALAQAPAPPPKILLDAAPRAVEYQLARLTNDDLVKLERKPGDVRYRPVYFALLTRAGLAPQYVDEALTTLAAMDGGSQTAVLLEGLARTDAKNEAAAERLLRALLRQPAEALAREQPLIAKTLEERRSPSAVQGGYGAMMAATGNPTPAWDAALKQDGDLIQLLRSVPYLGNADALRAALVPPTESLLATSQDPAVRAAAVSALGSARPDAATFRLIAEQVVKGPDQVRDAGVGTLQRLPKGTWPRAAIEPLARALLASVAALAPERRTEPASIDAVQVAEQLADALPDDARRGLRRDLRALGVQVVRITTLPEEMLFDVKWFAVEAGKPVQIVLSNPDAMSHNLLVTKPGALKEVGTAASTMNISADPAVKPYVPDSPLVLQATRLLNWGETERLNFAAPKEPGEYPFVCTFPGHWVRMYGVMLVVPDIEAWEAKRTIPTDPLTGTPYASPRK